MLKLYCDYSFPFSSIVPYVSTMTPNPTETGLLHVRQATERDSESLTEIYNWYIRNSIATFETRPISVAEMTQRISEKLLQHDWLVGISDDQIIGYAYYGSFRTRAAYNHTVESTIYLADTATGRGFGKPLYRALITSAMHRGFREMLGVIALPNPGSVKLHAALGFREVGYLPRVGYKFEQYIDVGFWQRSLA